MQLVLEATRQIVLVVFIDGLYPLPGHTSDNYSLHESSTLFREMRAALLSEFRHLHFVLPGRIKQFSNYFTVFKVETVVHSESVAK